MSRKSNLNSSALASVASEALAFDGSQRGQNRNRKHNGVPKNQQQAHAPNEGTSSSLAGGEAEGTSGDPDTTASDEADEEEHDGAIAAAFAPSGKAVTEDGDQAGLHDGDEDLGVDVEDIDTGRGRSLRRKGDKAEYPESDDDDYNAVDMISDSDEGDPSVEKLEERAIIQSVEADDDTALPSILKSTADGADQRWGGFDLDDGLFMADIPYFDEQIGRTDASVLASDAQLFNSASVFEGFSPPRLQLPSPRRVRFEIPHSDASDVLSNDGDIDALFDNAENGSMPDASLLSAEEELNKDDDESCGSSSGYESG